MLFIKRLYTKKKFLTLSFLVCVLFLVQACELKSSNFIPSNNPETLLVGNWNIQFFSQNKMNDPFFVGFVNKTIRKFDLFFIQEVRNENAFYELCEVVNYSCIISQKKGRSSYKEQYGVLYKNIELDYVYDYYSNYDYERWERPPLKVVVNDYIFYNIHVKPGDATSEISFLDKFLDGSVNTVLLGDLNADCKYYSKNSNDYFSDWIWLIEEDTTVAKSICSYDRIILSKDLKKRIVSKGVLREGINNSISDHYLIWVELKN